MTEAPEFPSVDTPIDLTECDREPIHAPGAIQPHGALIVARVEDLHVTHASANLSPRILGQPLADVIGSETCAEVEAALRGDGYGPSRIFGAVLPSAERPRRDLVAHRLGDFLYAEFEPVGDGHEHEALLAGAHAMIEALRRTTTRQELCETAVREIKALTGYDRTMLYRFDEEGHGEVIAEAREPELEPLLGLHYPASDVPKQARRLYLLQRVRAIADVAGEPVPVLAHPQLRDAPPLDMSFCTLRSISPVHVEYLRNMKVAATVAVSLIQENALWGMLICHHRVPRTLSAHARALCDLIGQLVSLLIGTTGQAEFLTERLKRQTLLDAIGDRAMTASSVAASLAERPDEMLRLVEADGALIRLGGQVHLIGRTPDLAAAVKVTAALRARCSGEAIAIDALGAEMPEFAAMAATASGALTLPILHNPEDAITWFRQEVARTVAWGGDPDKPVRCQGGRVLPRTSFAAWRQLVQGRALPWRDIDLQTARDLRRLVSAVLLRQTEAQLAEEQRTHLSYYDALTHLPNRRLLQARLEAYLTDPSAPPAALIFLDLDRFKMVNDSLGHLVGDDLLVQMANRLVHTVPDRHLVARLGGDEFVVLCQDATLAEAQEVANRIVAACRSPFILAARPYLTTASVGVAPATSATSEDLLRAADAAMYEAKRKGGNQAVTFDSSLYETVLRRLELEQDLFQAIERKEFELYYQPLVHLSSGDVFAFEALLRWHNPRRGLVAPGEFVHLAEETDLIVPIGNWVMQEALRQVGIWRERHQPDLRISVNVSAQQLARKDFPDQVAQALAASGVSPSALLLEVTESILMQAEAVTHLEAVRASGVGIAIDDFGTGYSSLSYLQQLPVDEIKIDKLFVDRLGEDARQTALMGALVQLVHTLDLKVIAEGVEREAQLTQLRALSCDAVQGYWLSRPVPAAAAERLLHSLDWKHRPPFTTPVGQTGRSLTGGVGVAFSARAKPARTVEPVLPGV